MKKQHKTLLIGFILLWVLGFAVMWGFSIFKKAQTEKRPSPQEISGETAEGGPQQGEVSKMPGGAPGGEEKTEAVPVRCYKVNPIDFQDDLPVMGTVKGSSEINLKFEVNGVIAAINFREGDMVNQGDLIAALDKKDAKLKVDYAKSKLDSAKTQALAAKKKYEIHKHLYDIGGIIKAKLEEVELEAKSAEFQAVSAETEVKSAESELKKTDLYAPRNGVLGSRDAEVGEFVTSQNKIATLYDTEEVSVELGIIEKDVDKIALGQSVTITADSYPGTAFKGVIDNIFPVIEGKSRTLTVRVKIKNENENAMLLPGMFARAMVTVAEFKDALVVPSVGLNKTEEGYKVFVVDGQKKVRIKNVQVGYVTTDYTVINEGLEPGDLVVTETPQELKEEMPVEVVEVQEAGPNK